MNSLKCMLFGIRNPIIFLLAVALLSVCKSKMPETAEPFLDVSVSNLSFGSEEGTQSVTVTCNQDLTVESPDKSWCNVELIQNPLSKTIYNLVITVAENKGAERTAGIALKVAGLEDLIVTATQWAYDYEVVPIRIATYNICVNTFADVRMWSNRKILISSMIQTNDWDIIGTQEGSADMMNDLCALNNGYQWLGRAAHEGDGAVCMAIMYKLSRFDVLESGDFWYSETPDVQGSIGWGAPYTAKCTWVKFRDKSRDKVFYFFNSHYSATKSGEGSAASARAQSALLMKAKIKEIAGDNTKVFATGDYNSTPTTDAIRYILEGNFLKDSRTLSETPPSGPDNTCNDWKTPNNAKYDWIFLTAGIRVLSYTVLDERPNGQYPSDHDPVMIDIEF